MAVVELIWHAQRGKLKVLRSELMACRYWEGIHTWKVGG